MSPALLIVLSLAGFFLAAFFAGAETAIIAADRVRMHHLAARRNKRAMEVLRYFDDPGQFLSLVLVGTNLGVIGCTTTFTALLVASRGDSGAAIATVILVPTLLIFEEIIPKALFLYYADRAALLSVYPLKFFGVVLFPVVRSFSLGTSALTGLLGVRSASRRIQMTAEELLFHLQDSREAGLIPKDTLALASRAFEFLELTAGDVMIPIDNVVMAPAGLDIERYWEMLFRTRFTRLPLYGRSKGDFVGVLSIRGVLEARGPHDGALQLEEPYEVPAGTPVSEILIHMRNQGGHMAMVRGDDGAIAGMATLEDVLEKLVGAMSDEFH
jgi:putative hemolysin